MLKLSLGETTVLERKNLISSALPLLTSLRASVNAEYSKKSLQRKFSFPRFPTEEIIILFSMGYANSGEPILTIALSLASKQH